MRSSLFKKTRVANLFLSVPSNYLRGVFSLSLNLPLTRALPAMSVQQPLFFLPIAFASLATTPATTATTTTSDSSSVSRSIVRPPYIRTTPPSPSSFLLPLQNTVFSTSQHSRPSSFMYKKETRIVHPYTTRDATRATRKVCGSTMCVSREEASASGLRILPPAWCLYLPTQPLFPRLFATVAHCSPPTQPERQTRTAKGQKGQINKLFFIG